MICRDFEAQQDTSGCKCISKIWGLCRAWDDEPKVNLSSVWLCAIQHGVTGNAMCIHMRQIEMIFVPF